MVENIVGFCWLRVANPTPNLTLDKLHAFLDKGWPRTSQLKEPKQAQQECLSDERANKQKRGYV